MAESLTSRSTCSSSLRSHSAWWLLARHSDSQREVLTLTHGGSRAVTEHVGRGGGGARELKPRTFRESSGAQNSVAQNRCAVGASAHPLRDFSCPHGDQRVTYISTLPSGPTTARKPTPGVVPTCVGPPEGGSSSQPARRLRAGLVLALSRAASWNPRSAPYTLRDNLLSASLRGRTRGRMEHGATTDGLPALNRQTLQKARERAYLERFRENFAEFPEGEVVSSESPDFLVKSRPRWIGIELIEYHVQEPDEGWGSPMRAQEGTEDKVLRSASRLYQSKDVPPVVVSVLWNPHRAFSRRRIQELAAVLADLVQEHLPELGHRVAICYRRHPAWRSLPQEVESLTVDRQINFSENAWTSVRGASVPTLTPPQLQKKIRNKEAKVSTYRRKCREVWLLIVARGFEPSTHVDIGSEVESYQYESGFDRVFFLHHANEYVAELHVRPAS